MKNNFKIEFSNHSLIKLHILKEHGLLISKKSIIECVSEPDKIETGYRNRIIAQKKYDETHVLRVIYEKIEPDIIHIITIYPGRRTRYEKDQI